MNMKEGEEMPKVPNLQIDLQGHIHNGAYWNWAEFRFVATHHPDGDIKMWLEDAAGNELDTRLLDPTKDVRPLINMEKRPYNAIENLGIQLVVRWMWGDDQNEVDLGDHLEEIAEWLRYVLGDMPWTGGEVWEY